MQKILAVMLASILATALVAQAAAKKEGPKPPTRAQIEKATEKAIYDKEHIAIHKLPDKGGDVRFIPAKIGDYSDDDLGHGVMLGRLDSPQKTPDGNPAALYQVYMCKRDGKWAIFYCLKGEVVAAAETVTVAEHNLHEPAFIKKGKAVHYWYLNFSY